MKSLLAHLWGSRPRRDAFRAPAPGVQPGLWTAGEPTVATPSSGVTTPSAANPFAGPVAGASRPSRPSARRRARNLRPTALWTRLLEWLGSARTPAPGHRLFPTNDQLELVLGRPRQPARNRDLEIGQPAHVRRSGAIPAKSKVIYESKPASSVDATRMMEESDRAYARLRGRRLESLRVAND